MDGISRNEVSRLCVEIDDMEKAFLDRTRRRPMILPRIDAMPPVRKRACGSCALLLIRPAQALLRSGCEARAARVVAIAIANRPVIEDMQFHQMPEAAHDGAW